MTMMLASAHVQLQHIHAKVDRQTVRPPCLIWMSWVIIHFRMFLRMMQWSNHCVLWQISLVVVFVWVPAPFVCLVCCFSWRNASLAGDLRVVWLGCVLLWLLWFACISRPFWSLYKVTFYRLCSCKDRATVRHRPNSRKKKWRWCLQKNYWADSECALNALATTVIFTLDHVSPPVSPFIRFSPLSLRHGVVVVCFEVFGWTLCLNGCSLWSRGSWLGGSLVSALSFVAAITLLPGPFVWFCVFLVLLLFRWPYS